MSRKKVSVEVLIRGEVVLPMSKDGKLETQGAQYKVDVIAALFNLSVRRIQQLTQEGVLPTVETKSGRRYELVPTIRRYVEYLSNKAYGKNKSEAEAELKQQKLKAEIDLKELQSEHRKIQNDIATGKYIGIDEVQSDYRQFFIVFKKFALGIPSKLSVRLNGLVDDPSAIRSVEAELNRDILALLNSFVVAGQQEIVEEDKTVGSKKTAKKSNAKNKKI